MCQTSPFAEMKVKEEHMNRKGAEENESAEASRFAPRRVRFAFEGRLRFKLAPEGRG